MAKRTSRALRRKLDKLTPLQAKVLRAKIDGDLAGKKQAEVAQTIWPNQTPAAASVSMTRVLKSANANDAMQQALAEAGLTAKSVVDIMKDAMQATKPLEMRYWIEDEEAELDAETDGIEYSDNSTIKTKIRHVPDHSIRMGAARTVAQWMGVGKSSKEDPDEPPPPPTVFNTQVNNYIKKT